MGIEPCGMSDVPKCQFVQLLTSHAPKSVDRNENRPCEKQSHTAYYREHFKVSQEKVAFKRRSIEDFNVWSFPEWNYPIEPS
jgi:hypothetical protein